MPSSAGGLQPRIGATRCGIVVCRLLLLLALIVVLVGPAWARPQAVVVVVSDQHSAYDKLPQLVARIDRLRRDHPAVPMAVLIDGDVFEAGNALARRTEGALDYAVMAALVKRAPTVLTIGNHEPDLTDLGAVVRRLQALGLTVLSANVRARATGHAFAPGSTRLKLGRHTLTIVGVTTDRLTTFRAAERSLLAIDDPVTWGKDNLALVFRDAELPVVLSHAGLRSDKPLLGLVPNGTLFAGGHDHLQFVHQQDRTVYFQSGSWLECVSIATLEQTSSGLRWHVEQEPLRASDPSDPDMAGLVRRTFQQHLSSAEREVVGHTAHPFSPAEAARFATDAARQAAGADVAVIGGTTFGGGLPAGAVTRYDFDGCVRFDGAMFAGEVDGRALRTILARANQGPATPFTERSGENLVAVGPAAAEIVADRRYRLVTTDWIARNPRQYLGDAAPALTELPTVRLKPAVVRALNPPANP